MSLRLEDHERLRALDRYAILDALTGDAFDHITDLAAHLLDTPIVGIHVIDDACQWATAQVGMDARFDAYLAKPYDADELLGVLQQTAERSFK